MTRGVRRGVRRGVGRGARRGAVLPLVCILMFVLVLAAAFALDVGRMQLVAVEVQTAADAGALAAAGAGSVASATNRQTAATAAATAAAAANRAGNAPAQVTAADVGPRLVNTSTGAVSVVAAWADANAVEVTARATPTYALAGIAGLSAPVVVRRATAMFAGKLDGMSCLMPMMLPYVGTYNRLLGTSLTSAPDMTAAQMATISGLDVRSRSAIYLPPGETSKPGRNDNENWSAVDYTDAAGTMASYTDWAKGLNCGSAKARLKNNPATIHRFGAPSDYVLATTDAMNAVCNYRPPNGTDANCYASPTATAPGITVRVTLGDASGAAAGSPITVRSLTTARIMCYFRVAGDKCQGAWLPEGYWNPPYNANGYPAGTLVVLYNSPFPGELARTTDLVFGPGNAMSPIVTGVASGHAELAR